MIILLHLSATPAPILLHMKTATKKNNQSVDRVLSCKGIKHLDKSLPLHTTVPHILLPKLWWISIVILRFTNSWFSNSDCRITNSDFETPIFQNKVGFSNSNFWKQTPVCEKKKLRFSKTNSNFWEQTLVFNKTNTNFSSQPQMSLKSCECWSHWPIGQHQT